jgi:hypothetical protein
MIKTKSIYELKEQSDGTRILITRIKTSLYAAMRKQTLPMRLDTLEKKNRVLHRLLTDKTKVEGTLK